MNPEEARSKALAIIRHPQHSQLNENDKRTVAAEALGIERAILDRLLDGD